MVDNRTCVYCGKEWRTGTMDLNRYCSVGCWADDLNDIPKPNQVQAPTVEAQHVALTVDTPARKV